MENASKALIMAGGVLIGILILSLAVYLFIDFGGKASVIHDRITSNQLTQFNAQFNIYAGRIDVTIYQIITVANLAYQNNMNEEEEAYKVKVFFDVDGKGEISKYRDSSNLITDYSEVDPETGQNNKLFRCDSIKYHANGRVSEVHFSRSRQ